MKRNFVVWETDWKSTRTQRAGFTWCERQSGWRGQFSICWMVLRNATDENVEWMKSSWMAAKRNHTISSWVHKKVLQTDNFSARFFAALLNTMSDKKISRKGLKTLTKRFDPFKAMIFLFLDTSRFSTTAKMNFSDVNILHANRT